MNHSPVRPPSPLSSPPGGGRGKGEGVACYIAIGSNQGERLALCEAAVAQLAALPQSTLGRRSAWYETEPVVEPSTTSAAQPAWFINGVIELRTSLAPGRLLDECLRIEHRLGRRRDVEPHPPVSRPIDLDLLLYGDAVINEPGLTLPHPRLHRRRFVLAPLAELAPDVIHPALHATISELLSRLADDHAVHRFESAAQTASSSHPARSARSN